jgi:hypothetical protein
MLRFPLSRPLPAAARKMGWFVCLVSAAALALTTCGNPTRQLDSLTITPAAATANGSAVQFTATGHWSASPTTVMPEPATWGACTTANAPTTDVTVSTAGLASCTKSAKGAYNVFAWDPQYGYTGPTCNFVTACGSGCGRVSAAVQLTCP